MNLDTVLMCAQMTARQQIAALGYAGEDVQALIDELTPAPVVVEEAAPVVEEAAPVVEEAAPVAKKATAKK
jgi:hypothetical protein